MTKREQKIMNEQINSPLNDKNEIKSDAISLHNINYVGKINLRVNETNIDLRNKVNDPGEPESSFHQISNQLLFKI